MLPLGGGGALPPLPLGGGGAADFPLEEGGGGAVEDRPAEEGVGGAAEERPAVDDGGGLLVRVGWLAGTTTLPWQAGQAKVWPAAVSSTVNSVPHVGHGNLRSIQPEGWD